VRLHSGITHPDSNARTKEYLRGALYNIWMVVTDYFKRWLDMAENDKMDLVLSLL
jgi:hypothetical protein